MTGAAGPSSRVGHKEGGGVMKGPGKSKGDGPKKGLAKIVGLPKRRQPTEKAKPKLVNKKKPEKKKLDIVNKFKEQGNYQDVIVKCFGKQEAGGTPADQFPPIHFELGERWVLENTFFKDQWYVKIFRNAGAKEWERSNFGVTFSHEVYKNLQRAMVEFDKIHDLNEND